MSLEQLVNICFHGIGTPSRALDPDEDHYWISPEFFREVVDYAVERPRVRLSFDDGNASDVAIALPRLQERSLRATFFPIAARIGRVGSVDERGLRALVEAGMTIGSHGMHHTPWRGLDDARLEEEFVHARSVISTASGTAVTTAACPLGSYDRRALRRLRALGYDQVFTSDRSRARDTAWLQPRYSVRSDDDIAAVRAMVDAPQSLRGRAASAARITVKRWR